jgi:uncharacterized protein involved in exopolysaccharide biosynthesis
VTEAMASRVRGALPGTPGEFGRLLMLMVIAAALAVGVTFLLPPRYVAETSILLDSYSDLSSLLSMAQSSDILPGGILPGQSRKENGYSYASIVTSRATLSDLLHQQTGRSPGETYLEVFAPRSGTPQRKMEVALSKLKKTISTRFEQRSGVFQVSVAHRSSAIATGIANLLAAELRRFNTDVRTTRARDAVGFVADRLAEAKQSLNQSENELAAFRSANARIGNAPELLLRQSRLEREVHFNENIYALLSRQYELARIQEKNETPVFTVMDPATEPTRPHRMSRVLTGIVAGLITGLVYLLGKSGLAAFRLDRGPASHAAPSRVSV